MTEATEQNDKAVGRREPLEVYFFFCTLPEMFLPAWSIASWNLLFLLAVVSVLQAVWYHCACE